ncbi:MAG: thiol reductase thioredoxin [Burkholderiales bacterium RIFCSPLOWO2_02_FULL_57_36]|nr:MAG: thiol reductase thioredoxin [Burkholderiales bacterium RIFCSPLOWO2_02_FULL_57_36]
MAMTNDYSAVEPARETIDLLDGPTLVEFGTDWCGYCRGAQPLLALAMDSHPTVRHIKIEDGRGRRLGRSFRVKLWPTLIFLSNGTEVARLVRPGSAAEIREALARIDTAV